MKDQNVLFLIFTRKNLKYFKSNLVVQSGTFKDLREEKREDENKKRSKSLT